MFYQTKTLWRGNHGQVMIDKRWLRVFYRFRKADNWIFPKWLSLNSANSVNHDQIQQQYGYQSYYQSSNRYIANASNTKVVFITASG